MVTECDPYGNDLLTTLTGNPRKKSGGENDKGRAASGGPGGSAAKSQALNELLVLSWLRVLEIIEELAALVHKLHQSTTGRMIPLVSAKMSAKSIDALGEQRDLYL
jgi:hypothetical protein